MKRSLFAFPVAFLACSASLWAQAQEVPVEEVLAQPAEEQRHSVQEFYSFMQEAIDDEDWWSAIDYAEIVLYNYPESPFAQEIPYFIGQSYYRLKQYELANNALTDYLKKTISPKFFQEAIEMKFDIAEFFREGGKKRLFSSHKMPAIIPAREDAIQIYDEVIATLPHHEIAAKALLGKARVQAYLEDYKPSIETLQLLIRRFPRHDLAIEGYLEIAKVYLGQCEAQQLDPDVLGLAEANIRKFRAAFPREERVREAEKALDDMREVFARSMLETAEFFQRRSKNDASVIYFTKVISKYPRTQAAEVARAKLEALQKAGAL